MSQLEKLIKKYSDKMNIQVFSVDTWKVIEDLKSLLTPPKIDKSEETK